MATLRKKALIHVTTTTTFSTAAASDDAPAARSRLGPVAPLTEPIDAEDYIGVLLARQAAWEAEHPRQGWMRPLLEWFIADGDEQ